MIAYHNGPKSTDLEIIADYSVDASNVEFSSNYAFFSDVTDVATALDKVNRDLSQEFQLGVDYIYGAILSKDITPASKSLDDIIIAVYNIPYSEPVYQGTFNAVEKSSSIDMGPYHMYAYVNTMNVENVKSLLYQFPSGSKGNTVDMGVANNYKSVNASLVYSKGYTDGLTEEHQSIEYEILTADGSNTFYPAKTVTKDGYLTGFSSSAYGSSVDATKGVLRYIEIRTSDDKIRYTVSDNTGTLLIPYWEFKAGDTIIMGVDASSAAEDQRSKFFISAILFTWD